jgi:flagellar hook-associated protein 2
MSVSSTSKSGSSLDVASIVKQLMEVESRPLTKLDTKISVSSVKISTLGQFNSQLSALQSTLTDLQTPSNFSAWSANFSAPGVATAQLGTAAVAGSYQMEVSQLAQPSIWNVSGFTSEAAARAWYNHEAQSTVKSQAEVTVFKTADQQFTLSLKAKSAGESAGDALDAAVNAAVSRDGQILTFSPYQPGADAAFKLNGVLFTRPSNTVTDALTGVTLNLTGTTATNQPINLTVAKAESSARPKLEAFVKAYNDLQTFFKAQTVASVDVATRGVLNSDFAVGSMMRQLLNGLMMPLVSARGTPLSGSTNGSDLTALGIKLQDNGTLTVDDKLLKEATDLQSRLANGIKIGFDAASGKDLVTRITDMLASGGMLQERIKNEQMVQKDLNTRKIALQDKLASVQARYTAQYAALDALLFQLNSTSDSLKSALDGLTSSQKNN